MTGARRVVASHVDRLLNAARGAVPPPVAIGGVGGSGTRIGAAFLQICGYDIGADLNDSLDNLWFTLFFKRRSVLLESAEDFSVLAALFFAKMSGGTIEPAERSEALTRLTECGRLQHEHDWLAARANSFADASKSGIRNGAWGWKEPNTHIVIERLLETRSDLRYIHFVRHPLDMALSENKNQLQLWGPILLDRDVTLNAKDALAYWCAAHRRISAVLSRWPERSLVVDFDALCEAPDDYASRIGAFIGVDVSTSVSAEWNALVKCPGTRGRYRHAGLDEFGSTDLEYVTSLGFALSPDARTNSA